MYRGLIHFHSQYSYDSILSIKQIVSFALKNKLNFLILTDHETIKGSTVLKEYIKNKNLGIEVLIAAEYNTEYGDIIAINLDNEIKNMKFEDFILEARKKNAILLFPHPYKGHKNIDYIAKKVDIIEIFNARVNDSDNLKALKLAQKYNKPLTYATDAHNLKSLKNAIVEFKKEKNLLNSLLNSKIKVISQKKTYLYELYFSQYIKSFKKKNIKLFIFLSIKVIKSLIQLKLFRRI